MLNLVEIIYLGLFALVVYWSVMLLLGRADGTISITGFDGKKLREQYDAAKVRLIKAISLMLFAGTILLNVFVPNRTVVFIGLVILVLSDPIMLLCRKKRT